MCIRDRSSSGLHLYGYQTPNNVDSIGILVGPSFVVNGAIGTGAWTGAFDSGAGSYGLITGGPFWSNPLPAASTDDGYVGLSLGIGKGHPGVGFTTTDYKRLFPDRPLPVKPLPVNPLPDKKLSDCGDYERP